MYVYVIVLVTVSSNICNLMHAQIKHSLSHLQDLISALAGVIAYTLVPVKVGIKSSSSLATCKRVYLFMYLATHICANSGQWKLVHDCYISLFN